jgi:hypothetical protein
MTLLVCAAYLSPEKWLEMAYGEDKDVGMTVADFYRCGIKCCCGFNI